MAMTLLAFLTVRLAANHWIRPHLIAPLHQPLALDPATTGCGTGGIILLDSGPGTLQPAAPTIPHAWITSVQIVNPHGRPPQHPHPRPHLPQLVNNAASAGSQSIGPASDSGLYACVARIGRSFHELVTYQPASRYWTFQSLEVAIYFAATILLAGACFWLIRHRDQLTGRWS